MTVKQKAIFKRSYNFELSNNRCSCGPGSDGDKVVQAGTIDFINRIIKTYGIKSINDCPCGLFENWMRFVDLNNVRYTGFDINDDAVERNRKKYPEFTFVEHDMVGEALEYADLIIARDIMFHLSNKFVMQALSHFKNSGSKYLLATEHRWVNKNVDLTEEELNQEVGFRFINLEIEPYCLGAPLEFHDEEVWRYYEKGHNRQMALWRINDNL